MSSADHEHRISTLFFRNKYLLVMSMIVIVVAGLSAMVSMPRLEDPRIMNRNPLIITVMPGASAKRVEALVTEKIEKALQEISEIKEIRSTSRTGVSIILVELMDSVDDNETVFAKIRDKLADVTPRLPSGAASPIFDDRRGAVGYTAILGLVWDHEADPQLGILNRLAEDLSDRLRGVPGTEIVRIFGAPQEEITVSVDHAELAALGLGPRQVADRIRAADSKVPAGIFRGGRANLLLEVTGELDSLRRVGAIPLREGADGSIIRVGDVARVERNWQDPPREIGLADGKRAVFIAARVRQEQRVDQWMLLAQPVIDKFSDGLGDGIRLEKIFDQTVYTRARLVELGWNFLAGTGVIVAVIFFIMGWRSALIVGSALPLTISLTLFIVASGGGALHQMSIFGMIIAIGLVIDNAIVMVDEVNKNLTAGKTRRKAMAAAIRHLSVPLFASTLTTVLAFAPIVLLPGNIGDFVGAIGGSVIVALLASFLITMTITPSLAGLFGQAALSDTRASWWQNGVRFRRLSGLCRRGILFGLRRPLMMALVACALPLAGFALSGTLGSQFFPPVDRNMFGVRVWLPSESSLAYSRERAEDVEAAIRRHAEVKHVNWLVGGSFPSVYYNLVMNKDNAANFAQAVISATSSQAVKGLASKLQAELDLQFPELQIVVRSFAQGPPVDAEIEFKIFGPAVETLQNLGEKVRLILAEHPGVLHTQATMSRGEPKLWFDADENEVRLAGMTLNDVAAQLQGSLEGLQGGSVVEDLEEMPVRIRYRDARRSDLAAIRSTNLVNGAGGSEWIPLSALGDVKLRLEAGGITRFNGVRVNKILGFTRSGTLPIDITRDVMTRLDQSGLDLPAGYRIEIGGDAEQEKKALGSLQIYLPVLVVLMAATIVLSFKSVRLAAVLGVVAFMSIGLGLLATWLSGFPVSFNSILGTAGLIGLALNDSIVVLAAIRANPAARAGNHQAIMTEVLGCMRHVISTTLTTMGGFLPLLIFVGGDFWPPLAIVLAGGVLGSTILAVTFVPAAYLLVHSPMGADRLRLSSRRAKPALEGAG